MTGIAQAENKLGGIINSLGRIYRHDKLKHLYHRQPSMEPDGSPYTWQAEIHNAGKKYEERGVLASNQIGKSRLGAAETAIIATGLYPPWWDGYRTIGPAKIWCGAESSEASRDVQQRELIGPPGDRGTGWIPRELIRDIDHLPMRQCGLSDVVDRVYVRHVPSSGWSEISFKSYQQGVAKWRGQQLHLVWLDEPPPPELLGEVQTRLLALGGRLLMTYTPLKGWDKVALHFYEGGPGIYCRIVSWHEAPHLDEAAKQRLVLSYPEHERDARTTGMPTVGSGLIYNIADCDIEIDPHPIPKHWPQVAGCDFGIDHHAAGVWMYHNLDNDQVVVYDGYKKRNQTPIYHAAEFKARGSWIPVAWPHDGLKRGAADGLAFKDQYAEAGVNMMPVSARTNDDKGGSQSTEGIITQCLDRMRTGRLKVFRGLIQWFDEKRFYHRNDDGKIVRKRDDMLSATHTGLMMIRYAEVKNSRGGHQYNRVDRAHARAMVD